MQKIRQAMILAAGKGTRLRPLTLTTPKPLVEVGGTPLIVWHIRALKAAGVCDIVINTSWLSDKLMAALGDGREYGVRLHWSVEDGEPLETAGGIAKALHTGKLKNEPFILINGDVWTEYDFAQLVGIDLNQLSVSEAKADDAAAGDKTAGEEASEQTDGMLGYLLLIDNPEHNPKGDFVLSEGRAQVAEVARGDAQEMAYTFSGLSVLSPNLVSDVQTGEVKPLAPILKQAMLAHKIAAAHMTETWIDVGTPERLAAVNDYVAGRAER